MTVNKNLLALAVAVPILVWSVLRLVSQGVPLPDALAPVGLTLLATANALFYILERRDGR